MAKGLIVTFYTEAKKMNFESEKANRPIFEDRTYIKIIPIGDNKTVAAREVTEADKERYPEEWARFAKGTQEVLKGTPLSEWSYMSPSMIRELNHFNIFTVEHLSEIGDDAIQRLGMGARNWKKQAKAYLEQAKDGAAVNGYAAENERLKDELSELRKTVQALSARVDGDKPSGQRRKGDTSDQPAAA